MKKKNENLQIARILTFLYLCRSFNSTSAFKISFTRDSCCIASLFSIVRSFILLHFSLFSFAPNLNSPSIHIHLVLPVPAAFQLQASRTHQRDLHRFRWCWCCCCCFLYIRLFVFFLSSNTISYLWLSAFVVLLHYSKSPHSTLLSFQFYNKVFPPIWSRIRFQYLSLPPLHLLHSSISHPLNSHIYNCFTARDLSLAVILMMLFDWTALKV